MRREEIPRVILLYYSYNSPWDIHSRKVLYDYVLSSCETDSYVYRAYGEADAIFSN